MKCFARCALVFSILCIGGTIVLGICAWFAADWLNSGDKPVKADRMLILSGDPLRSIYAAELYHQGFAKDIYLTRSVRSPRYNTYQDLGISFPRLEDITRAILLKKGVKDPDIHFIEGRSVLSTVEEAYAFREFVAGQSDRGSLLIITSPFHVRRAKMVFHDALPGVAIFVVASPHDPFPDKWWTNQAAARQVVLEYAKSVYYMLGGRFTSQARPQLP